MDMDKILYDDGDGIFAKLRRDDYTKDEAQLDLVREFVKKVNTEIREGKSNPKDIIRIIAIVHDLFIFSDEADWTADFATEIYHMVNFMVD